MHLAIVGESVVDFHSYELEEIPGTASPWLCLPLTATYVLVSINATLVLHAGFFQVQAEKRDG